MSGNQGGLSDADWHKFQSDCRRLHDDPDYKRSLRKAAEYYWRGRSVEDMAAYLADMQAKYGRPANDEGQHLHPEYVFGCYRCELSREDAQRLADD